MTTLLSAEWYKLWRGKVLHVILLCITAQISLQVFAEFYGGDSPMQGQYGVTMPAGMSFMMQLWFSAFVGYFIASEFPNGTMRNSLALGKYRTYVYVSKLFAACVAVAVIYLVSSIVATVGFSLAFGFGDMSLLEFARFFSWNYGMQVLFHWGFAALLTLIAFISRSPIMTVLVNLAYVIGMLALPTFLTALGYFDVYKCFPDYYVMFFENLSGDSAFIIHGAAMSVAYLVITCIIGCIVFKRTDIK
ncbi:ABC transporter permease [Paenibacillus kobensis]|uniref:ABC transporter permease n=1 Tax=Paenibacillus kobensis TaxID=59841 RepID=UPI000FDBBDF8|nr:ABC transporter permease [Paenibacillus kobensis]